MATRGTLGRDYYVTGSIALDTDVFDDASVGPARADLQAIVDHELGHVVGLDHVEDPAELMYASNSAARRLRPGRPRGAGAARLDPLP